MKTTMTSSNEGAQDSVANPGAGQRSSTIKVGVIGYGYWGPNIVRNLNSLDSTRVQAICDKSPSALARVARDHRHIQTVSDPKEILRSTEIDAVAIVTPVWTHFELAKEALENGKHVFVEKPFTADSKQAEELIELAERKRLTIMVDHTFLFTGAVKKIDELIRSGVLGKLYYYDSVRVNLGSSNTMSMSSGTSLLMIFRSWII